ncbi:hypothetical protein COLO4_10483 [Corchorus olitorius]|uniref:Uncharacterized protein n=1 Tax=Corchorus olitorius TaxID=93759 RepID=A0A1R3K8A4_9ROSI|nr:hypothetical protein COLO4_10483 [Corchorus olitorius]
MARWIRIVKNPGFGLTSSGQGLTSNGHGLTPSGQGLTSNGHGLTPSGQGLTSTRHELPCTAHEMPSIEHELPSTGETRSYLENPGTGTRSYLENPGPGTKSYTIFSGGSCISKPGGCISTINKHRECIKLKESYTIFVEGLGFIAECNRQKLIQRVSQILVGLVLVPKEAIVEEQVAPLKKESTDRGRKADDKMKSRTLRHKVLKLLAIEV